MHQDPGPLSNVDVMDVDAHNATVAYTVRDGSAGPHRVGARAAGTDRPWTWTEPRNGSGRHEVRLTWLHANTTHRFTVQLENADGEPAASVNGTFRTEPVPYGWAAPGSAVVRPGAAIAGGEGQQSWACTAGFILTDAANATVYVLTAGHCLRWAQEVAHDDEIRFLPPYWQPNWNLDEVLPWTPYNATPGGVVEDWGYFAYSDDEDETLDWGLVRVLPRWRRWVSPTLVHWTGPSGVVSKGTVEAGDDLCYFGQAGGSPPPMRDRCGHLLAEKEPLRTDADGWYTMEWPAGWDGDSGSPVIDYESGRALGLVTHAAGNVAWGPMLEAILDRTAEVGYDLRLATAGYEPPMALPIGTGGMP